MNLISDFVNSEAGILVANDLISDLPTGTPGARLCSTAILFNVHVHHAGVFGDALFTVYYESFITKIDPFKVTKSCH